MTAREIFEADPRFRDVFHKTIIQEHIKNPNHTRFPVDCRFKHAGREHRVIEVFDRNEDAPSKVAASMRAARERRIKDVERKERESDG